MNYVIKCHIDSLSINSLGVKMNKGDSFECPKRIYDSNIELKSLISSGAITSYPKMPIIQEVKRKGLVANTRIVARPKVQEKVVQETVHHHHETKVDLDELANKLLEKLSGVLSPEMIAQAVASQIPTQQVIVNSSETSSQPFIKSSSEELTFIPSKIISDDLKSSASNVSESSSQDEGLSDALSVLRAMKKKN